VLLVIVIGVVGDSGSGYLKDLTIVVHSCGNVYLYTVTDDRVGRDNGKEGITVKNFPRRDCIRKFSYYETLLCHLCSEEIPE
jgi:hypothetical protein